MQVHNTGFETTPAPGIGPPASDVIVRLSFAGAAAGAAPDLDANFWTTFRRRPRPAHLAARREVPVHCSWAGPGRAWCASSGCRRYHARQSRCAAGARLAKPPRRPLDHEQRQPAGGSAVPRRCRPRHPGAARGASHRRCGGVRPRPLRAQLDRQFRRRRARHGPRPEPSDIIVVASSEADPTAAFTNISDPREADIIRGQAVGAGVDVKNFVYIRVWNNKSVPLSATVRLYYAPVEKLSSPAGWTEVHDGTGSAVVPVNDIPPHGHKFSAEFRLTNPPDPAPGTRVQGGGLDRRGESTKNSTPNVNAIADIEEISACFPRHRKRQQCGPPRLLYATSYGPE